MRETPKSICVLGLGYIGLPTASMFATHGHRVTGVDVNPVILDTLGKGAVHIEEPGLSTVVKAAIASKNLELSAKPKESDVFIIAVPTPYKHDKDNDPKADLSYVTAAAESILPVIKKGNLVILESTSPAGTTRDLLVPILQRSGLNVGADVGVAYCPERVIPGQALKELTGNDRVVGAIDQRWGEVARNLYKSFVSGEIIITEPTVAEMVKLLENTFRDVNIALANEVALLCEKLGINAWNVIQIANRHPRVNVHRPGPGVGGHCISVDPWFLVEKFPEEAHLIRMARKINDRMPDVVVDRISELMKGKSSGKITVLGLAYKGNVDDDRESPAVSVVRSVIKRNAGWDVAIYEPHVRSREFRNVGLEEAFRDSDMAVVLTAHDEYKFLDPDAVARLMKRRLILDTHNLLKGERWAAAGFDIKTLGVGGRQGLS